nr:MAG TPA_asm: hypothetical protein [Caudoviricetes sp.]
MSKNYIVLDGKTIKKGGVKVRIEIRCFENSESDIYELWENYGGGIEMPVGSETYKEINMVMDAFEKVAGIKYTQAFRTFLSSSFK